MTEPTTTPTASTRSISNPAPPAGGGRRGPRVTVRVPGPLRSLTDGASEVALEAGTVGSAVDALLARHPGLRRHLRTESGGLREHVNLFRNEEDSRYLDGEDTALGEGDVVTIVPSIAGG